MQFLFSSTWWSCEAPKIRHVNSSLLIKHMEKMLRTVIQNYKVRKELQV